MVYKNEEHHKQTNEERAFSGIASHLVSELRRNREVSGVWLFPEGYLPLDPVVVESVIEMNFLLDFFLHTDQTDLLISLSLPLHSHHDILPGIFGQELKHWMFGEVHELVVDLITIVR
jgi:hypothetical protein